MKLVKNASQEDEQPTVQDLTAYRARPADSLIRDLESEENEIARIVAGKILDEVLLPPKQEFYAFEEMIMAELDCSWQQSHRQ